MLVAPLDSASLSSVSTLPCQAVQAWRVRGRTYRSPALLSAVYETPVIMPAPKHRVHLSTLQVFEPYTPRHARRQARQNPPIPLSLVFVHIPHAHLPALAPVSCASTRAQPHPRTLRYRPSKSRHIHGESRRSFASCGAGDVTHKPDVPMSATVMRR